MGPSRAGRNGEGEPGRTEPRWAEFFSRYRTGIGWLPSPRLVKWDRLGVLVACETCSAGASAAWLWRRSGVGAGRAQPDVRPEAVTLWWRRGRAGLMRASLVGTTPGLRRRGQGPGRPAARGARPAPQTVECPGHHPRGPPAPGGSESGSGLPPERRAAS